MHLIGVNILLLPKRTLISQNSRIAALPNPLSARGERELTQISLPSLHFLMERRIEGVRRYAIFVQYHLEDCK